MQITPYFRGKGKVQVNIWDSLKTKLLNICEVPLNGFQRRKLLPPEAKQCSSEGSSCVVERSGFLINTWHPSTFALLSALHKPQTLSISLFCLWLKYYIDKLRRKYKLVIRVGILITSLTFARAFFFLFKLTDFSVHVCASIINLSVLKSALLNCRTCFKLW